MKVLLIQSYLGRRESPTFPLGLAYLCETLKEHECTILDTNTVEHPMVAIEKAIEKTDPDVIGVSLRNIDTTQSDNIFSYFDSFAIMLKFIDQIRPDAKIVVGGAGFSIFAQKIMKKFQEIDYGVFLEGEYSFPELLKNMDHPERVKGIYFRRNGKIFFTGRNETIDLDELVTPRREFPGLDLRVYKHVPYSIGVQTRRGCAFRCAYCTYPFLQGRDVRPRSPKKIVDEIENLVSLYDVETVFFADTVFNFPLNHARDICKELTKRKIFIKWRAYFREDFINKRFMIEARNTGCDLFEFSPDGGSQYALDVLQKDITIQELKRTSELTSEIEGVRVCYNFFYQVPGENRRTVMDFYKNLFTIVTKCWKRLDRIGLNNIRIYPHTRMHQIALSEGLISTNTDLLTPTFYLPRPINATHFVKKLAELSLGKLLREKRAYL